MVNTLMVEQMLEDFDHAYGLKSVSLRYFNAAGADALGRLGERHDPETHLVPLVLQAASGSARGAAVSAPAFGLWALDSESARSVLERLALMLGVSGCGGGARI